MTIARNQTVNPWRRLMDLESHDLVKQTYEKLHGRELSTGTANDITSLVAQGKEYPEAVLDLIDDATSRATGRKTEESAPPGAATS